MKSPEWLDLERRYKRVQKIARIGDWSWDVRTGDVTWSDEVYRIFGVEPQVPSYELARSLVHPGDRAFWEESVRVALEEGKPLDVAYRAVRPDGTVCWIKNEAEVIRDAEGNPLRVFGTAQDITFLKQAESDLRVAEEMFRTVIEASPNCIFVKDADGRYLLANPAIGELYGFAPGDMVGRTDREFADMMRLGPEDAKAFVEDDRAVIRSGRPRFIPEERFTLPDGTIRWFQTTKVSIAFADKTDCMLGVAMDITEQKRGEDRLEAMVQDRTRALEEAQASLVRQEKLALLGQLAGGVGHELRNPLGAIKNAAYFLDMVLEDADEEVRESLGILNREVGNAERIIRSLFDVAGPEAPARTVQVDLTETIREELSRIPIPASVSVTTDLDESLPRLEGDPERLGQIVRNLIQNALQAMPDGGRMRVSAAKAGNEVRIRVADTGEGIPKEVRSSIFEPLFTTKAKGIGLGLALCRSHAMAHGGTIEVESGEGEGAAFTVRLPATRAGE